MRQADLTGCPFSLRFRCSGAEESRAVFHHTACRDGSTDGSKLIRGPIKPRHRKDFVHLLNCRQNQPKNRPILRILSIGSFTHMPHRRIFEPERAIHRKRRVKSCVFSASFYTGIFCLTITLTHLQKRALANSREAAFTADTTCDPGIKACRGACSGQVSDP